MRRCLLVFLVVLEVVVLPSCNKEQECNGVVPHYASDASKRDAIAPLTGTDTLTFLYNNRDTQIYVGQGLQTGWKLRRKASPGECDDNFEYLIYEYKAMNAPGFTFKMECYVTGNSDVPFKFQFKNVDVGDYFIAPKVGDSIYINSLWYYEPYYWAKDLDTSQYVMFCDIKKNPTVGVLKIKYLNNELTLLK